MPSHQYWEFVTACNSSVIKWAELWKKLVAKHGLQPFRFEDLVAWPFGDYVFGCDWDVMTSTTKARQFGFPDVVDSEEMFVRLLKRLRQERVVP